MWGDTNGDDGDFPVVGEASISLATACYGRGVNGNSGHDETDVLYIAFSGTDAVPGADGAAWNAQNYNDFEASITAIGDRLIERIGGSVPPGGGDDGDDCSWPGHCEGESSGEPELNHHLGRDIC